MIRLIIKHTCQPPIDTPAQISFQTYDIEDEKLEAILKSSEYQHRAVIGAELLGESEKQS